MGMNGARSLQLQLALRLAALYIAATAIAVGVLVYQAYSTADSLSDQDLNRRAADLANFVVVDGTGEGRLDLAPKLRFAYESPAATVLFVVRRPDGQVIAASHPQFKNLVSRWPQAWQDASYFLLGEVGS